MAVRTKPVVIPANAPYQPVSLTQEIAWAIKGVATGTADAGQQSIFMKWLVWDCAKTYEMSFRAEGPHPQKDQDFAEGKRFVGNSLIRVINMTPEMVAQYPKMGGAGPGEDDEMPTH